METRLRSVLKTISWRLFSMVLTGVVVWFLTRRFDFAATVSVIDASIKSLLYFFHERLWLRVSYGKVKLPEYEI